MICKNCGRKMKLISMSPKDYVIMKLLEEIENLEDYVIVLENEINPDQNMYSLNDVRDLLGG